MATIDVSTPASVGGRIVHLVFRGMEQVVRIVRAYNHRRAVNRLLYLDAHMLRDMGITQADVHSALSGSFTEDPSRHLENLAHERRLARRSVSADWPYRGR